MATSQEQIDNDVRGAVAIARLLAKRAGSDSDSLAGPEFLLAGVAKVLGPDRARQQLQSAGAKDIDALFKAIPDADACDLENLPEVKADDKLASLIKGELKSFLAGNGSFEDALEVLLAVRNRSSGISRLLDDPASALKSVGQAGEKAQSTRFLLSEMSAYYGRRWHLGYLYHSVDAKRGLSDFADGGKDKEFSKAVDELYDEQRETYGKLFSCPLYEHSVLGQCWNDVGEIPAHVLGLVILSEIGQVGDGPLSVREIAWSLSPKYAHRHLATALDSLKHLEDLELVQEIGGSTIKWLGQRVIPTDDTLKNFLEYLRDADPISEQEQLDLLKAIY